MTAPTRRSPPGNNAARDRILAAALELFARDGFDGTTVRAIADVCGLTDAALYYYYPTKRSILEALMTRPRTSASPWATEPAEATDGWLTTLVDTTLNEIAAEGPLFRIILDQAIDGDRIALALRAKTATAWRRTLLSVFADGPPEMDADRVEAFMMLIHGAALSLFIDHGVEFADLSRREDVRAHIHEVVKAALGAPLP